MTGKKILWLFNLNGAEHVNIVRRLRNCFAHSSGRYNPNDNDHEKTMNLIRDILGLSVDDIVDWPLSINTVLRPLFEGCVNYAKQKMELDNYDFREL